MTRSQTLTGDSEGHSRSGIVPTLVAPGQIIGDRYVALRPLGSGGMGSLWVVEHRSLGTQLALKLLHQGMDSNDAHRARFEREAKTAASIDHPNVVKVVDHHVDPTLGPFLVMELLDGESLHDTLCGGPLDLRSALRWLDPVAQALDAIHELGFVHRDVKPANIMRVDAPSGPVVKLVDFGLAARQDGTDRVTRKGMLLGTPDYVAPELAMGKPASPQSDVYALAITAYEMLTGKVPYEGSTGLAILAAKSAGAPPSVIAPRGMVFALPIQLAFQAALHPSPTRRPARATHFVEALLGMAAGG